MQEARLPQSKLDQQAIQTALGQPCHPHFTVAVVKTVVTVAAVLMHLPLHVTQLGHMAGAETYVQRHKPLSGNFRPECMAGSCMLSLSLLSGGGRKRMSYCWIHVQAQMALLSHMVSHVWA